VSFPKEIARERGRFHLVSPNDLLDINEYAEWLNALLYGQCKVEEYDGELCVVEIKHLVSNSGGVKVEIFSNEHPPPHFHVKSKGLNASFSIENCEVIDGKVTSKELKTIKYWQQQLKPKLIQIWNDTRPDNCTVGEYQGT